MQKKLFLILFFACFGLTTEICFVAITNLINQSPFCNEPLWSLTGKTYVWMLPIHGLVPILAGPMFRLLEDKPRLLRLTIYVLGIFAVEFITGGLLELIIGKCPWEYTTGWHIMGYIRLDYFPAWFFYAFLLESLYNYLENSLSK